MDKYILLTKPRSRSYWLSKFLTYKDCKVEHDFSLYCSSIKELISTMPTAIVDTGLVIKWEELLPFKNNIILIERENGPIISSCKKLGLELNSFFWNGIESFEKAKKHFEVIPYSDLETKETCRYLFEKITKYSFDIAHWNYFKEKNIQKDISAFQQEARKYLKNIELLYGYN